MTGAPNQSIYNINNTIGVSTVVYCGYEALSIPMFIIEELRGRTDKNGEIEGLGDEKVKEFPGRVGDIVKFAETSPLFGFLAEIKKVDIGGRLMVKLDKMLGSARDVAVAASDVGEIVFRDNKRSRPNGLSRGKPMVPANGGSLS